MNKIEPIVWVLICLSLFAFGYVGYGVYRTAHDREIQNQPAPVVQTATPTP